MSLSSTFSDIRVLVIAALVGAALGAGGTYWATSPPKETKSPTIRKDSTELALDELTAGLLPNETTVHQPMPWLWEKCPIPEQLVNEGKPPPDTVTEYETRFTSMPGSSPSTMADASAWGERAGLRARAQSRHPFLFLPLDETGEPLIDHNGRRTVVPAYSARRGYEFTYRYQPPTWEGFVDVYGLGQWWPPLHPQFDRMSAAIGADVGLRYKRARLHVGGRVATDKVYQLQVKGVYRLGSTGR